MLRFQNRGPYAVEQLETRRMLVVIDGTNGDDIITVGSVGGSTSNNVIVMLNGDQILIPSAAQITLNGLGGNDTYIAGAGDTVVEAAGAAGGADTVQSSLISLDLANYANVENPILTGALALSTGFRSARRSRNSVELKRAVRRLLRSCSQGPCVVTFC